MTPAERREGGVRLCRRLAKDVAHLAPEGIGRWDRAWDIVGPSDAEFMLALAKWEETGSEDDKPALRAAYFAVLDAWRQAAAEYGRQGAGR